MATDTRHVGFLDWPYGDSFMAAPLGGTLKRLFPGS